MPALLLQPSHLASLVKPRALSRPRVQGRAAAPARRGRRSALSVAAADGGERVAVIGEALWVRKEATSSSSPSTHRLHF
jgi:hypothetical protein